VKKLGRVARDRGEPENWLAAGLAASIVSFAVGMFTYDSLSFVQEAFIFWVVLALSASLLRNLASTEDSRRPVQLQLENYAEYGLSHPA
jgi:hypothetical protein